MKNFLLISIGLVVLFCAVSNSYAAISFDSSSTSATLLGSTGTLSIVVGSGSNRAIIACITMNAGGTSTLLVGGSSATQIAHRVQGTKAADLYYFLNPSAGTVNVTATLNAAANKVIGLESLFGVDQSTPVEATTTFGVTGSTVASTTFTTIAANDWIIDCLGANQTSTSPGTGQTTTSMNNAVNPFIGMSYKQIPATGATTTQWTFGTSTTWAYSTAALRQAAPDGTSVSTTTGNDGAVSGNSITITGTNFGTVSAGNRGTCNGGVGTGCIKFIVGGNATIPDANVSAWTTSSITFSISSTLQSEGGASALQVWATNASDTTPLTLYIYPKITSIASVGTNAARVYNATDTDGLIMLSGDHLGTVTSTPTIFGITSTIHYSTGGSCTVAGYASTTQCLEVSASIATSTYSGTITFTRGSDSKQATTSLSILPRILAVNPGSTSTGNMVQIVGDHLCPSGTCPVSPNRATSTNKVVFGSTTSSDSDFLDKTGGGGTCNGSSAAWGHGEICVQVAAGTPSGSASTTVTGNGLASNIFPFTVISGSAPGTPGTPTYSGINSSTLTVNWASSTNSNYYKIERATSSQSYVQISTTSALSYGDSGLTANSTFYYRVRGNGGAAGDGPYSASSSVLTLPDVPGTPTYTNVGATSLTVNWTVPTGGAASYIIQRATSSQVYAQVATTTATSTGDSGLTVAVTYYYRVQGVNATGNGAFSASSSVTTADAAPGAPSQDSPLAASQNATTSAVFLMTATEADNDNLQYKVTIYSNAGCTTVIQTNDQSASQTGWSGQNASSSMEYTAGTQGIYTTQSALTANTTYYWRASAKDPEGANTWTNSATCNSFTTTYGNWTTDSGSWSISSNQLTVTPASSSTIQLHVTGQSQDGVIEFKAKTNVVGANSGNISGVTRADTGAYRYLMPQAEFITQADDFAKTISSTYTVLRGDNTFTFSTGTFYDFRGYISETTLTSWINGGTALTLTDTSLGKGGFSGLAASSTSGGTTFTFDDFAWYTSTSITMINNDSQGLNIVWAIRDSTGAAIKCSSVTSVSGVLDISTSTIQIPVDYDNGGGSIGVWTSSSSIIGPPAGCVGSPTITYPSSGLATDIFGGDTYTYTSANAIGSSTPGGTPIAVSTITIGPTGLVSY